MPVTEFASLSLIPPNTLSDPHIIDFFSKVSSWQSSSSGYPLTFFTNPAEPAEIYLITGWDDVRAHERWIASSRNQELLQIAEAFLNIIGMVHLDLDFNEFPAGAESLVYYVRSTGAAKGVSEEAKSKSVTSIQCGWTGHGRDVQDISTGVYYFAESDTHLEDGGKEDTVHARTHLKRVKFT
ncbi:uncharacterized protein F5147DRAFT_578658 [Suillus discolor]|uniref:ABM domain-containing protein n=1 Tax=Suillus discolor TaxID=1912936 RepID=A0A9P7JTE0_9AGAM|nr:uncharacterized protein F5147DRAFT_578658 [Suillus discolor]KAG2106750.1 hypothetical protein F5147DRAFT_578658 [Suillus discolor]